MTEERVWVTMIAGPLQGHTRQAIKAELDRGVLTQAHDFSMLWVGLDEVRFATEAEAEAALERAVRWAARHRSKRSAGYV